MKILYKEELHCKATLVVLESRWYLSFEEQGPDKRYKKRAFQVQGGEWKEYCQALLNNFERYECLKAQGNQRMVQGEKNQWIRFGFKEGVCLFDQNYPVKKKEKLQEIIEEIEKSAKKAEDIIKKAGELEG